MFLWNLNARVWLEPAITRMYVGLVRKCRKLHDSSLYVVGDVWYHVTNRSTAQMI